MRGYAHANMYVINMKLRRPRHTAIFCAMQFLKSFTRCRWFGVVLAAVSVVNVVYTILHFLRMRMPNFPVHGAIIAL